MQWIDQWRSIDARIAGIINAANFLVQAFQINDSDSFGSTKYLFQELKQVVEQLQKLEKEHRNEIPEGARDALCEFYVDFKIPHVTSGRGPNYIQVFSQLAAFRSRFEFLIADSEAEGMNITELAFEHLKRTIAVNDAVRLQWMKAWKAGEVQCERLGAVHLLGHGIWAFKAQGPLGATDIIYGEPLDIQSSVLRRTSRVIVLTEWKVVRTDSTMANQALSARNQTKEYSAGVLGGLELKRTRYIPLVTERQLEPPGDVTEGDIRYRHVVIPVDPDAASVAARRSAR